MHNHVCNSLETLVCVFGACYIRQRHYRCRGDNNLYKSVFIYIPKIPTNSLKKVQNKTLYRAPETLETSLQGASDSLLDNIQL